MPKNVPAILLVLACVGYHVNAQQASRQPSKPRFDVVSVKSTDPSDRRTMFDTPLNGRFRSVGTSLKLLIAKAYDVQLTQVFGGPVWLDSDRFDIEAKAESAVPGIEGYREIMLMLQAFLEDRFKLSVHFEFREEPIYELVVSKGGSKLKEAKAVEPTRQQMGRGQLIATATPMSQLLPLLSLLTMRQVIDKTELTGLYDFTLTYSFEAPGPNVPTPIDPEAPSIFTAVQEQLGMKLESATGPVNVLVIEHAEKPDVN
jgi:uncharacterized protein (TIGR03435 family)